MVRFRNHQQLTSGQLGLIKKQGIGTYVNAIFLSTTLNNERIERVDLTFF